MIIKTYDLNKNIDAKIFLFHGINEGQKEEIIEKKFKPIFGKNVFKYYEKEIFSDIENFYNQVLLVIHLSLLKHCHTIQFFLQSVYLVDSKLFYF